MKPEIYPHDILCALRRDHGLPEDNALWPPEPDEGIDQIDITLDLVRGNFATISRFGGLGRNTLATSILLCLWAFADELRRSGVPVTFAAP